MRHELIGSRFDQYNRTVPSARDDRPYLRLQADYFGRLGVEVGIFVAVDHLRRAGRLSRAEQLRYVDIEDWFDEHLPNPPFYDDGNTIGAVTWFKPATTEDMVRRLEPLQVILTTYDVAHVIAESTDPGRIIYDDEFQVGVIPYARQDPTPLPAGVVLGPTRSGSKRELIDADSAGDADVVRESPGQS